MAKSIQALARGVLDILSLPVREQAVGGDAYIPIGISGRGRRRSERITLTMLASFVKNVDSGSSHATLADLEDVELTDPALGDVLQYTGTEWVNAPLVVGTGNTDGYARALMLMGA